MDKIMVYLQSRLTVTAVIEIMILTFCIYKVLMWIRGTQAEQVAKGVLVFVIIVPLSKLLGFTTLNYLFNNLITWLIIIIAIVFQPEMRSALENLGNKNFIFGFLTRQNQTTKLEANVQAISNAVGVLSNEGIGALIVCEDKTGLKDIVGTGVPLNADISAALLENLFTPNRPLHDGAVVLSLKTGKILGAGCLLPLTDKSALDIELGTRHRAGIGISEQSDAVTLIVSEETGTISCTEYGSIVRELSTDEVKTLLYERFAEKADEDDDTKGVFQKAMHPVNRRRHDE